MRVEKNKVSLGTCNFPTPLLDKPLFAALDIYDINASLTLVADSFELPKPISLSSGKLCWEASKKPTVCTLSDGDLTIVKSSG